MWKSWSLADKLYVPNTHPPPTVAVLAAILMFGPFVVPSARAQSADEGRLFVRGYGGATWGQTNNGGNTIQAETYGAGVGLKVTRHFAVVGDVGYITSIASYEGVGALLSAAALVNLVSGPNANVNLKIKALPVLGGGRFTFGSDRFAPFAEGLAGITRSTFTLEITGADPKIVTEATKAFTDAFGKSSSTTPTVSAGGGADIRIAGPLAAEAGYHYVRLFGDAKSNIHEVFAGVRISF